VTTAAPSVEIDVLLLILYLTELRLLVRCMRVCDSDDYIRLYAPKCGGCGKPITSSFITAVHQNWHLDCFVCFVSISFLLVLGLFTERCFYFVY